MSDLSRAYDITTLLLRQHAFSGFEFSAASQEELAASTHKDSIGSFSIWQPSNHDIGLFISHHALAGKKSEISISARLFKEAATSGKPNAPGGKWWDSAKRTNADIVRDFMTGTFPMIEDYWDTGTAKRAANIAEHAANCTFLDAMAAAGSGTAHYKPYDTNQGSVASDVWCKSDHTLNWSLDRYYKNGAQLEIYCTDIEALAIVTMLASRRKQLPRETPY